MMTSPMRSRRSVSFANHVMPAEALTVVRADPDDNRILECAAAARSDYLVTGDKHLLKMDRIAERKS